MNTAFTETVRIASLEEENRLLRAELDEISDERDERDELRMQVEALKARVRDLSHAAPGPQRITPRPITAPVDRALAMATGRVVRA